MFADEDFSGLDGAKMENYNFAPLFSRNISHKLLILSKYIVYRALSLIEEKILDESTDLVCSNILFPMKIPGLPVNNILVGSPILSLPQRTEASKF